MRTLTKQITYVIATVAVGILATGCDRYDLSGFFASPSIGVDKRFAQSLEYNATHPTDTLIVSKSDSYSILLGSDFHIEQESENLPEFIATANKNNAVAAIITGDITDQKGGIDIAADILKREPAGIPLRTVVGNHDLYFGQWENYKTHFGTSTYHFVVQTPDTADLFVCLDSGNGTLGKKQTDWLAELLKNNRHLYRHCIVATHTNFFDTDMTQIPSGLFPLEETAVLTNLFAQYNVTLVANGHDHHFEEYLYNGTRYLTIGSAADRNDDANCVLLSVADNIDYRRINI